MLLLILPWCCLWMLLPFSASLGASAAIVMAAGLALSGKKWTLTIYDGFTGLLVAAFALIARRALICVGLSRFLIWRSAYYGCFPA